MPVFLGAKFIIKLNSWGLDNIYSSDRNENGKKPKQAMEPFKKAFQITRQK